MSRERLPDRRKSWTAHVHIEGQSFFLTCGEYPDGRLGEVFLTSSKAGTFLRGVLDTLAMCVSLSLQNGVPVQDVVKVLQLQNYPPNGQVIGSPVASNATSVADWVAQEITAVYCSGGPPPEKVAGYLPEPWRLGV